MASEQSLAPTNQLLMGGRKRTAYNPAEREFSRILQQRLNELLEGKRNTLPLLRHYPNQPNRLGVMITPTSVPRDQLRLPVVEALIWEVMSFVSPDGAGGRYRKNWLRMGVWSSCNCSPPSSRISLSSGLTAILARARIPVKPRGDCDGCRTSGRRRSSTASSTSPTWQLSYSV